MNASHRFRRPAVALALTLAGAAALAPWPAAAQGRVIALPGDHIVAVVNQELVTAGEVERRAASLRQQAARAGQPPRPAAVWRKEAMDALIEERVVVTHARDMGWRIDESEVDRAVQSVAAQNQLTLDQLRQRLLVDGLDMARLRANLRDQIMVERTREREVIARIGVTDDEIERERQAQRATAGDRMELNIAQILVPVPEAASDAVVAERRARIEQALARVNAGEAFDAVAKAMSEDGNRERGGEIGLRPVARLPDPFVAAVRGLQPGQVTATPLRSGAGFHVLKLLQRRDAADDATATETLARHILLRTSDQTTPEQAARRLQQLKRQIEARERRFEDVAREVSEDGSSAQGGDLGWFGPGMMVPEFEQPAAALAIGALSEPVVTRFGVHLIQVLERRAMQLDPAQRREQMRNVLRERKFQRVYEEWVAELRARAYIEIRDAGNAG